MTLEGLDTATALRPGVGETAWRAKLPHLDRLIETAADQILAVGRESYTVNAVFMPVWAFQAFQEIALVNVPDADALIERARSDVLGVGRDGDGGHAIFYGQRESVSASLDVPETDGSVTATRSNRPSVPSEIERVDILLVALEGSANLAAVDVPNLSE